MTPPIPPLPPAGIGDLLPPEARAQRALAARVIECFALHGYDLVTPPPFELAEVIERGIDTLDSRDLLRFVEPESGEVAVLRPDITPQVARIVATRLADHPPPWRLAYEGRVIRRRHGRARRHRQISQAGIECIGIAGLEADAESIALASAACERSGLTQFRIELCQVTLAQSALEQVPAMAREALREALGQKDPAALRSRLKEARIGDPHRSRLLALVEHYGDIEVLRSARRTFRWEAARAALRNLDEVIEHLKPFGLEGELGIDLSEVRGASYYTGVSFSVLAAGPGEPIGAGGRYDNLLGRYGRSVPATGFALDLDNLQWALRQAQTAAADPLPPRIVMFSPQGTERSHSLQVAQALRAAHIAVATHPMPKPQACLAFAKAWGYHGVLSVHPTSARLIRVSDGAQRKFDPSRSESFIELARWLAL